MNIDDLNLDLFEWKNGTKVQSAVLSSDGTTVQDAVWEGETPISASNLKKAEKMLALAILEQTGVPTNLETNANDNLVAAINEVNASNKDSGWLDIDLSSNFEKYDVRKPKCRKIGKIVNLVGEIKPASASNSLNSADEVLVGKLPAEFWPSENVTTVCQGSGTNIFEFKVLINGNITIGRYRNSSSYASSAPGTSTWLPFNVVYFV